MQKQLIPADFNHVRDKPKVDILALIGVKNVKSQRVMAIANLIHIRLWMTLL